jgi:hypothetical protein
LEVGHVGHRPPPGDHRVHRKQIASPTLSVPGSQATPPAAKNITAISSGAAAAKAQNRSVGGMKSVPTYRQAYGTALIGVGDMIGPVNGPGHSRRLRGMSTVTRPSFDDYVAARSATLLRFAYLLCGDRHLAEDLVQEVLIRAHRRWSAIEAGNPGAYLKRALVHANIS